MEMKKLLAIGIIFLFIGVAIAPSINANVTKKNIPDHSQIDQKTLQVSCQYVTYTGIEKIEHEITIRQYESLKQLFHQSDEDALVITLQNLGLLPKTMTTQKARDLLNGQYGRRELSTYQSTHYLLTSNVTNGTNMFCKIQGDAVDSYYRPLWWLVSTNTVGWIGYFIGLSFLGLDEVLRHLFRWYPLFTWDYDWGILVALAFFFGSFSDFISDDEDGTLIGVKIPAKLNGFISVNLDDAFHVAKPNLLTSGASGNWEIHNNRWVSMKMLGFTGIWVTVPDMQQSDGCMFKGFCLYIKAAAKDY
jgi:hypothetical protein